MKSFKHAAFRVNRRLDRFMRKLFVLSFLILLLLFTAVGCKTESTTILNTEFKIFYGGSQLETTVRELKVDGGKTTARIRFLNLGTEELTSIEALVEFVDAQGDTVSSVVISDTFDTPVAVGASFSQTAECDSNSHIKGVYVTEYTP
jgi:hypothetical protein